MKRIVSLLLLVLIVNSWFQFTDPYFPEAENSPIPIGTVKTILDDQGLEVRPIWTFGTIRNAFSTNLGGWCTLEYERSTILILSRGFTPPAEEWAACLIIPRKVVQIGNKYLIIAALVDWQRLEEAPQKIHERLEAEAPHGKTRPTGT